MTRPVAIRKGSLLAAIVAATLLLAACQPPGNTRGEGPVSVPVPLPEGRPLVITDLPPEDRGPLTGPSNAPLPPEADVLTSGQVLDRLRARLSQPACIVGPNNTRWRHKYAGYPQHFADQIQAILPRMLVVMDALEAHHLPAEFATVPIVESWYRLDVRSFAGAVGMWQFLAQTARNNGAVVSDDYDGRLLMLDSTDAAMSYLGMLDGMFHDWRLVGMAYNSGEYRLAKTMSPEELAERGSGAIVRYRRPGGLAWATYEYVSKMRALICLLDQPARQNIPLDPTVPVIHWVRYTVPPGIDDLDDLAQRLGTDAEALKSFNGYRRSRIPADAPRVLYVPGSTRARWAEVASAAAMLPAAPATEPGSGPPAPATTAPAMTPPTATPPATIPPATTPPVATTPAKSAPVTTPPARVPPVVTPPPGLRPMPIEPGLPTVKPTPESTHAPPPPAVPPPGTSPALRPANTASAPATTPSPQGATAIPAGTHAASATPPSHPLSSPAMTAPAPATQAERPASTTEPSAATFHAPARRQDSPAPADAAARPEPRGAGPGTSGPEHNEHATRQPTPGSNPGTPPGSAQSGMTPAPARTEATLPAPNNAPTTASTMDHSVGNGSGRTTPAPPRTESPPPASPAATPLRLERAPATNPAAQPVAPAGSASQERTPSSLQDTTAHAPTPVPQPPRTYKVQLGDSLQSIATQLGVKVEDLRTWNHLAIDATLYVDQVLKLGP